MITDNKINNLNKYMFNETNLNDLLFSINKKVINQFFEQPIKEEILKEELHVKEKLVPFKEEIKIKTNKNNHLFIPFEKDKLFWCFYIIKNGEVSYEMLYNKNFILEKKLKIDYVDKIRQNKQLIKKYKFATLTHIENMLANENKIDIYTFFSLCLIENINIVYIHKKTYYELIIDNESNESNESNNLYLIYNLDNCKFGFEIDSNNKYEMITKNNFKVDKIDKPIKCMTYYKVNDLLEICNKLNIEIINNLTNKNKSKKDLYESIIQYF